MRSWSKLLIAAFPMLWALSAGSPVSHQALAADFPTPMEYQVTTEFGFEFNIVPLYLWLPGVNGTVGVLGSSVEVDLAPIDIISNLGDFLKVLDGVYMGVGEVRYRCVY